MSKRNNSGRYTPSKRKRQALAAMTLAASGAAMVSQTMPVAAASPHADFVPSSARAISPSKAGVASFQGNALRISTVSTATVNPSLGAQGNQGAVGPQGPIGFLGIQGPQGAPGAPSAPGLTGAQGANGTNGTDGTNGTNGAQGYVGTSGAQGDVGALGPQGANGTNGTNGTDGTNGTSGAQGDVGALGPQGPQGDKGTQGDVGPQGQQGAPGPQGSVGGVEAGGASDANSIGGGAYDQIPVTLPTAMDGGYAISVISDSPDLAKPIYVSAVSSTGFTINVATIGEFENLNLYWTATSFTPNS